MRQLYHPNVHQLYAVCTSGEPFHIVTEPMKHGSLLDYLKQEESQNITAHEMVDMLSQISAGKGVYVCV